MKALKDLYFPEELKYSLEHIWIAVEGNSATIGVTDYAQDQLGEVTFVDLPQLGMEFNPNDEFGTIESIKSVSELYMPIQGRVTSVNETLEDIPTLVNQEPYKRGWLIKIEIIDSEGLLSLMDNTTYLISLEQ